MNQAVLPSRIQEQLAAAEALETQEREARATANKAVVKSAADLVLQQPQPPQPAAPTNPPPSATPQAPAATTQPPATDSFEQKYRTLQGMYNAEVPALKRKTQEQEQTLARMAEQLRQLTEAKTTPAPAQPAPVDPADVKNFGADMMEMVPRIAQRVIEDYVTRTVLPRLQALEGNVKTVSTRAAETEEQRFYSMLDQLVPDWPQINETIEWKQWLGVKDDVYGVPRQVGLDNAFSRGDAAQVARIFKAYKATLPPPPAPAESLQQQIVPESGGTVTPPTTQSKPILSSVAITRFYNDMARGAYVGREQEAAAIEAEINAAVAEGRVR